MVIGTNPAPQRFSLKIYTLVLIMSPPQAPFRGAPCGTSKAVRYDGGPPFYDPVLPHQIGFECVMAALRTKGESIPGGERRFRWRRMVLAGSFAAIAWWAAYAKDSTASVKETNQYIVQGNLRVAEIQLPNAIRETPQDPVLHARLAEVHFQLGEAQSAEREARAARERNGNEADYLPVLVEAMFGEGKFADLVTWCNQATRMRRSRARSGRRLVSRRQVCAIRPGPRRYWAGNKARFQRREAENTAVTSAERNQTGRGRRADRRSDRRQSVLGRSSSGQR